jgi:RND family efflux transporter MFP subunit
MRNLIILMVPALFLGVAASGDEARKDSSALRDAAVPAEEAAPQVRVSRPVIQQVTDYQNFTGRAEAASTVQLRARVTGYLNKVAFKEGSLVKRGDLLFEIDARPYRAELAKAEASMEVAVTHLKRAENDFKLIKAQFDRGTASPGDLNKVAGDRDEAAAAVKTAAAGRELARLNLDFTKVCAPLDGRIGRCLVDAGNIVKADDTVLATIVSTDWLYAYFDMDERTVLEVRQAIAGGKIKAAKVGDLPVAIGLTNKEGFPLPAKIDFVNNTIDPNTGTLRVRAVMANADGLLLPGLFVRVRLTTSDPYPALMVTQRAIRTDKGGGHFVYVVSDKGLVEQRPVNLGPRAAELVAVKTGLKAEDWVAVSGLPRLRAGLIIQPVKEQP